MSALPRRLPPAVVHHPPAPRLLAGGRRVTAVVVGAFGALVVNGRPALPLLAVPAAAFVILVRLTTRRRQRQHQRKQEIRQLPTAVAFAQLAVAAGSAPRNIPVLLGRYLDAPAVGRWHLAAGSIGSGASLSRAVDTAFADAPDEVVRLPLLLEHADRAGIDLQPTLARLADDVRRHRMAELDERAQRLAVRLLFPLVLCLLPAFVLLSMVPLAAGLWADLPW